jgi:hypothetical protein
VARYDTLTEIEKDVLDPSVPLATALRKVLILAGKSGSEPLRDWATRELKGYLGEDDLPDYRVIHAPLTLDGISGQYKVTGEQLAPSALPDFARDHITERLELRHGVGDIEVMSQQPEVVMLQPHGASDLARLMNAENQSPYHHIERIYWAVAPMALRGVLDQIRTALAQLVAEMRANTSVGEPTPSAEAANAALHVLVTGERQTVNITHAHASGHGTATVTPTTEPKRPSRWRRIGATVVGLFTIVGAIAGIIVVVH